MQANDTTTKKDNINPDEADIAHVVKKTIELKDGYQEKIAPTYKIDIETLINESAGVNSPGYDTEGFFYLSPKRTVVTNHGCVLKMNDYANVKLVAKSIVSQLVDVPTGGNPLVFDTLIERIKMSTGKESEAFLTSVAQQLYKKYKHRLDDLNVELHEIKFHKWADYKRKNIDLLTNIRLSWLGVLDKDLCYEQFLVEALHRAGYI